MDPIVGQAQANNEGKSILVQIHSSANGDIFYNQRIGGRLNYYINAGIPGLAFYGYPTCYVDGLKEPPWVYTVSNITNEIDNRRAIDTPIKIESEISQTAGKTNNATATINYKTTVTSDEVIASQNLRLLAFVVENNIVYSAPNGTQVHNHVALEILPDENGIPVDFSNENELSFVFEGSVEVPETVNLENLSIVAVLQDFGTGEVYQALEITFDQLLDTKVDDNNVPVEFALNNVFPNPFNPSVNIPFSIAAESQISLQVINIIGKEVDTLIENKYYSPGNYNVQWNAAAFPAGTYFIRMITPHGNKIQKAILLK